MKALACVLSGSLVAIASAVGATGDGARRPLVMQDTANAVAQAAGFGELRATPAGTGVVEIRVLVEGAWMPGHVLRLRHTPDGRTIGTLVRYFKDDLRDRWKQEGYAGDLTRGCHDVRHAQDVSVCEVWLQAPPRWSRVYARLQALDVTTLPDESELPPAQLEISDGMLVMVEVRDGATWRAYEYGNPKFHGAPEADKAADIASQVYDLLQTVRR